MKITVVGGTGHIGRFLVPMLVNAGHEVCVLTRGAAPLPPGPEWRAVRMLHGDAGEVGAHTAMIEHPAEAVVDIPGTARQVYDTVRDTVQHMVAIGSLWMFGDPRVTPTPEETQSPCPFEGYASRYEELLEMAALSSAGGPAFTAIMPPNICGPGKIPLDCLGGRDPALHRAYAAGGQVTLPDGPEALVGPCDAEDIARCVFLALAHREQAAGQIFNVGSAYALTWTEFVAAVGKIHGVSIPIHRVSWHEYVERVSPGIGYWWHMKAHMCPDISKARRLLGYEPQFTPETTLARAVEWMRSEGLL